MSCCPQRTPVLTDLHRVKVRYVGGRPVRVKGAVTGIEYLFSGIERTKFVDPRDAVSLIRNPLFRFEGIADLSANSTGDQVGHLSA